MERDPARSLWGPDWAQARALWDLDPDVAHCNHGSYGAAPRRVLAAQQEWQLRAQRNPVRFFSRDAAGAVSRARDVLAEAVGADAAGSALVANATTALATVLPSLDLREGDEVLVTDHAYGAVLMAVRAAAAARNATVVVAEVPLEADDAQWQACVLERVTPRTRVAVLDHITSATARLVPVAELVRALRERDVLTIVDAAHVPGLLPTDVVGLGADVWFGNFHKWGYAPPGTALLWVAPQHRRAMRALVVSWHDEEGYPASVINSGTADLTAWLAAPVGLEVLDELGPERLRQHNRELAALGQQLVAKALEVDIQGLEQPLPMRVVPLPPELGTTAEDAARVQERIAVQLGVETGVQSWNGRLLLRVSAQAYNHPDDYERLAEGLRRDRVVAPA